MQQLDLDISGMSCGHCIARVKQALEATAGVRVESVKVGSAHLAFDPAVTTPERISAAVTGSGYVAHVAGAAA